MTAYRKYHGLGNDYLVPLDGETAPAVIDGAQVRRLCAAHYGLGADGILYGPYWPGSAFFARLHCPSALCAFRVLNPDGSEAEKSGNGVRIFARYLFDCGAVSCGRNFVLATLGGPVNCRIDDPQTAIAAEMGTLSFASARIPVAGESRDVVNETLEVGGVTLHFCAVTVGNPHCVVLDPPGGVSRGTALQLGPLLERHPLFPHRTNVQFIERIDGHALRAEIYERGAGYTLASGTSACACAAAALRMGWCQSPVTVHMPGGVLTVAVDKQGRAVQCGPVCRVYDAQWCEESSVR